jgi:hypothetical protein
LHARSAGVTRSLAAERRFKRTDGASGRDLRSSVFLAEAGGGKTTEMMARARQQFDRE